MIRILSYILCFYGLMAILVGIRDCDGLFFLGLLGCIVAWIAYPKKKKEKDDKGKSYRDNRTWEK